MSESSIIRVAKTWSDVSELISHYNQLIGSSGVTHFFGYASIINDHNDIKPASSRRLVSEGGVANLPATLKDMVMSMNVLANGEYAFRATQGDYLDAAGQKKRFANVGCYAGMEPHKNGSTPGLSITANVQDRQEAWAGYMSCELGKPPEGITFDSLFNGTATAKLNALRGSDADKLGMYKLLLVNVQSGQQTIPAITVATNEDNPRAFIGRTPMEIAHLILDGQGYRRPVPPDVFCGGTALEYFKTVLKNVRSLGVRNEHMEEIAKAVEDLAHINAQLFKKLEAFDSLPEDTQTQSLRRQFIAAQNEILQRHPDYGRVVSPVPHILNPLAQERRDPVDRAVLENPDNIMPHTAMEKMRRITTLRSTGFINLAYPQPK